MSLPAEPSFLQGIVAKPGDLSDVTSSHPVTARAVAARALIGEGGRR